MHDSPEMTSEETARFLVGFTTRIKKNESEYASAEDVVRVYTEEGIPVDADGILLSSELLLAAVYDHLGTAEEHRENFDIRRGQVIYLLLTTGVLEYVQDYGPNSRSGYIPGGTEKLQDILTCMQTLG